MKASQFARLARKATTARRLPLFVLLLLVPTWALIGLSSAAIAIVPFRRLAPLLGTNLGATTHRPECTAAQQAQAMRLRTVIGIAARYAPFRSNCLPQSITARVLCAIWRVPCALHLGLAKGEEGQALSAHAWTACGPVTITGGAGSFARYKSVSCFLSNAHVPDQR
ncbi:lasso peptide biosynthesis B2 protein [Sphingomonas suaedae]|uniref:Lasso peptide biosynthesis B2 protein n=1 Tax=Sphingomonas suaedae TaxID=2599297 RepID=A0A518RJE8_9SPHN|nr:lasso peptide biosynthesis B2 protein [Sphingomonas suaedae]QDX27562.1 lasso peptide biosynthesis B2 protein [Sphingomonas suaedae]